VSPRPTFSMPSKSRPSIPIATQVRVLYRDGWLCTLCGRPTIFHLALKYLDEFVHLNGYEGPTAYFDPRWRRDAAPLLYELASMIDHVQAYATVRAHEEANLAVACADCNERKGSRPASEYLQANLRRRVKGRYGEPKHWDGLVAVFLTLARQNPARLTANERTWLRELENHIGRAAR